MLHFTSPLLNTVYANDVIYHIPVIIIWRTLDLKLPVVVVHAFSPTTLEADTRGYLEFELSWVYIASSSTALKYHVSNKQQ